MPRNESKNQIEKVIQLTNLLKLDTLEYGRQIQFSKNCKAYYQNVYVFKKIATKISF